MGRPEISNYGSAEGRFVWYQGIVWWDTGQFDCIGRAILESCVEGAEGIIAWPTFLREVDEITDRAIAQWKGEEMADAGYK